MNRLRATCAFCMLLYTFNAYTFANQNTISISENGIFTAHYSTKPAPIELNRIHLWIVYLSDHQSRPISGADIIVTGGMPGHKHGLPTQPLARSLDTEGMYQLEGMKFHMHGHWLVHLEITSTSHKDTITFELNL